MSETEAIIKRDELKEGALYSYKDGVLSEIQTDPDDTMKRVKIVESAFQAVVAVQGRMRKNLNGYRPDIHLVCSAIIQHGASQPEVDDIVKRFCLELFESGDAS